LRCSMVLATRCLTSSRISNVGRDHVCTSSSGLKLHGDPRHLLHRATPTETGAHPSPSPAIDDDDQDQRNHGAGHAEGARQAKSCDHCDTCNGSHQAQTQQRRPPDNIELRSPQPRTTTPSTAPQRLVLLVGAGPGHALHRSRAGAQRVCEQRAPASTARARRAE
jgi:hypothetical protein